MLRHLRLKFVAVNMAIVTVMLGILFVMVLHTTRESMEDESLRMMRMVAMEPKDMDKPGKKPEELRRPHFVLREQPDGSWTGEGEAYFDFSDREEIGKLVALTAAEGEEIGVLKAHELRYGVFDTPRGRALVFVDTSGENRTMEGLVANSLCIGGGSLLAFLALSFLLARWAVRPVEKAWQQQKQFVADASHELKTPITVIQTGAELLCAPDCTAEQRVRFSESIRTMSRQMGGLVESMLELARVDAGRVEQGMEELDFSALIKNSLLSFEALFFERGLELTEEITPGLCLQGSRSHLVQTVEILLDNARKYAAPGGEVEVRLEPHPKGCLLSVASPGEDLSPEECEDIFERFYRVDRVRSMDCSYGLGLPIARGILERHRGKIWCESGGGVNTFFVQLPLTGKHRG